MLTISKKPRGTLLAHRIGRALTCIVLCAWCAPNVTAEEEAQKRYICFGDSLTNDGSWIRTVTQSGSVRLIEEGNGGRRAGKSVEQLRAVLDKHASADGIILFLGVNDLRTKDEIKLPALRANAVAAIKDLVELCRDQFEPHQIIIIGPPGVDAATMTKRNRHKGYALIHEAMGTYSEDLAALANAEGHPFIGLYDILGEGHFTDGVHLNQEGDDLIAERIGRHVAASALADNTDEEPQ